MEIKCHVTDPVFCEYLPKLFGSLELLYSLDTNKFLDVWKLMPRQLRIGIQQTAANAETFEGTIFEDISDYCREVVGWYTSELFKLYPVDKPFTLRNPDDLKQFEDFLDRMLHLLEISPKHFVLYLEQCPLAYWDKMDDLRETSYKIQRDSEEYLRCLEKCKRISFTYSEIVDLLIAEEDEEIEDTYYRDED